MMKTLLPVCCLWAILSTVISVAPFGPAESVGNVDDAEINEASGLAASRAHSDILYTINDSGGSPRVYAISATSAALVARLDIENAANCDWEDIAVGPGPGGTSYIYIGDVGGNSAEDCRTIYRVREPANMEDQTLPVESTARYTWDEVDCETVMVDPSGKTYLVTKVYGGLTATVYQVPDRAWGSPDRVELTGGTPLNAEHDSNGAVGGDINQQGNEILIKMYNRIYYWQVGSGESIQAALQRQGDTALYEAGSEPQGESVGFSSSGFTNNGFYTLSEGVYQPLYFYRRNANNHQQAIAGVHGNANNARLSIITIMFSIAAMLLIKLI